MRRSHWLALAALLTACNPYVAAVSVVSTTYDAASDVRPLSTQASDTEIEGTIKANLIASPVPGTAGIDVFCRQGVVVLAGVVPPGSPAGSAAVQIARGTQGVVRVETFFVNAQASEVSDFEIKEKIKAAFVTDPSVVEARVAIGVYGGHVVLVGVVNDPAKIDEFVADARSVSGVQSVRSYIQLAS